MAKDLVRTRQYIKKFILMKANIQAVSLKVQTLKSQDAMAQVCKQTISFINCYSGNEGRHPNNAEHEQAVELASNPENYAGIRAAIRDNGHEGGDDGRRH